MANPKIQVDITADASKLKKGAGEAEKAIKDVDDAAEKASKGGLSGFGDKAGGIAKDTLGPLGDAAGKVGIDLEGMGASGAVAGAAIVGLGAFVKGGVDKLGEMTDEVRKFKDTAGTSWEDSSRLVAVMDDLGIGADEGAAAMGRLAKNIDAGKLAEYGIEVVRAKDGTVDMAATLGNVADAMNKTADPTQKAAMGTALFGKSWATLAPLLQQGSTGIRNMMGAVKDYQIVTAESAQQQRDYSMAMDDLQDAFGGLQMEVAKDAIPKLAENMTQLAESIDKLNQLTEPLGGIVGVLDKFGYLVDPIKQVKGPIDKLREGIADLDGKGDKLTPTLGKVAEGMIGVAAEAAPAVDQAKQLADAEAEAADQAQILAAHQADATTKAKELALAVQAQRAELDLLNATVRTVAGSQVSYDQAVLNTHQNLGELEGKAKAAADATAEHGDMSKEAAEAGNDYRGAVLNAEQAAIAQAQAEVDLAAKLSESAGMALTAEQQNIIYRDALVKVRDASNDPNFVAGMDNLIGQTDNAAAAAGNAAANYYAMEAAASRAAAVAAGVNTNSSGNIVGSADSIERALQRNTGAGFSTQRNTQVIQLVQDGRTTAEVVVPHFTTMERSRR